MRRPIEVPENQQAVVAALLAELPQEESDVVTIAPGPIVGVGLHREGDFDVVIPHHVHEGVDGAMLEALTSPPGQSDGSDHLDLLAAENF